MKVTGVRHLNYSLYKLRKYLCFNTKYIVTQNVCARDLLNLFELVGKLPQGVAHSFTFRVRMKCIYFHDLVIINLVHDSMLNHSMRLDSCDSCDYEIMAQFK